jgi:LacI family gluconate utilization system Gnt-II transcriptional activator
MKDSGRVTLQDIADLSGVTKMTVSRYLRDPGLVSRKNGEIIAQVLEKMHYIPNRAPEILLGSGSRSIGVMIPSFNNQVYIDVLVGIESVANAHHYQTLIATYNYDPYLEEQKIINMLSYNIDALILPGMDHTQRTIDYLRAAGIPVAELMELKENPLDIQVGLDNEQASFDMTAAMLARGKQHIVYIGSMGDTRDVTRYEGYARAMQAQGLAPMRIQPNTLSSISLGEALFPTLAERFDRVDGVFCTNDDLAIGILLACQRKGMKVPQDFAIAGFQGLDMCRANPMQVATVVTPRLEMGRQAMELILQQLAGEEIHARTVDVGYEVCLGDTV